MFSKYLELLGPVTSLLSHLSEKSNEASLKIPDWCCQLCTDITVHFRKWSKWGSNFQSLFKYAAVKFFYQIIQSPFPKELCIFVCCALVGGSFYIWIFINVQERMMYWWYCLLLLYHAKMHFPPSLHSHNPYCLFPLHTSSDEFIFLEATCNVVSFHNVCTDFPNLATECFRTKSGDSLVRRLKYRKLQQRRLFSS